MALTTIGYVNSWAGKKELNRAMSDNDLLSNSEVNGAVFIESFYEPISHVPLHINQLISLNTKYLYKTTKRTSQIASVGIIKLKSYLMYHEIEEDDVFHTTSLSSYYTFTINVKKINSIKSDIKIECEYHTPDSTETFIVNNDTIRHLSAIYLY